MTLYILQKKIEKDYIKKIFDEDDLERAINEANEFFHDRNNRVSDVVKSLLSSHLENPPNDIYKYALTPHAHRFLEFLGKKLFNEHTYFPLKETFQNYGLFKAEKIKSVKGFESWYEFNFKHSSTTTIEDHLEGFKNLVDKSILKLNSLTTNDGELAIKNLDEFVGVFKEITSRHNEIKETLFLSATLKGEIRKVVDFFEKLMTNYPHEKGNKVEKELEKLSDDYDIVVVIKDKVSDFFESIEIKLEQILERYLYADKQLSYYKENFRTRSRFQINLRAFLGYSLKQVQYHKRDGLSFSSTFPIKLIPEERVKLIYPFYYETFAKKVSHVITVSRDKEYESEQRKEAQSKLLKQEKVAHLVRKYKDEITQRKYLDLTATFYTILQETNDSDIALKVIHRLILHSGNTSEYELSIQREIMNQYVNQEILLWNMNIHLKRQKKTH